MFASLGRAALAATLVCTLPSTAAAAVGVRPAVVPRLPFASRPLHPLTPPGPPAPRVRISDIDRLRALAGGWQRLANPPGPAGHALLMTDGEILVQNPNTSQWFGLVPDATGSYVNGTWKAVAALPKGYAPLYYASAVLPDGRVIINGGEYNGGIQGVWTTLGAMFDPQANTWTPVAPPAGWASIGDAPSAVLDNGTYMLGSCCSSQTVLLNETTLAWTPTGTGKADSDSEEGWTLLPGGDLLVADVDRAPNSELYNPASGVWMSAGPLPAKLTQDDEIGPQILRQDGLVFVAGANANTAIYDPSHGRWTAGPNFPIISGKQVDIADGPAVLLTNGDVLMAVSPDVYQTPSYFLDFTANGKNLKQVVAPPNAPNNSSYNYNLLLLPTGQVLETDFSDDVEILTPKVVANTAIRPVISSVPTALTRGSTYKASGTRFNGVSQASVYGDDAQAATNYPLVQITNNAKGSVFYARTHGFSSMAVASASAVSTLFDVPSNAPTGPAKLVVIANGIASTPVAVKIH